MSHSPIWGYTDQREQESYTFGGLKEEGGVSLNSVAPQIPRCRMRRGSEKGLVAQVKMSPCVLRDGIKSPRLAVVKRWSGKERRRFVQIQRPDAKVCARGSIFVFLD